MSFQIKGIGVYIFKQQKDTKNVGYEKSLYRCIYVHEKLIVLWLITRREKGAALQLFISLSHSGPKGLEPLCVS